MRRVSQARRAQSRKDFYSDYGNDHSANRTSKANFDDLYGSSNGGHTGEFQVDTSFSTENDELDELAKGLEGEDLLSIATSSEMASRPRSLSDSTLSTLTAAFSGATEKDLDDVFSEESSVSTHRTTHSHADFDDVYKTKKGKSRRKKKSKGQHDEFEFSNPLDSSDKNRKSMSTMSDSGRVSSIRPASNRAKTSQAIYNVLATPGTSVEKARKLFVLEQLQQPAPPERPPSIWGTPFTIGKPIRQRRGLLAKRMLPTYDINDTTGALQNLKSQGMMLWPEFKSMLLTEATVLGLPSDRLSLNSQGSKGKRSSRKKKSPLSKNTRKMEEQRSNLPENHLFSVSKLMNGAKLYEAPWYTRIRMARAIAVQLKVLHGKRHVHGGLRLSALLLDKDLTLRLLDTGDSLDFNSQHFRVQLRGVLPEDIMAYEILSFGVTLLALITRDPNVPIHLKQLLELEGKSILVKRSEGQRISSGSVASARSAALEKAEALQTSVEDEIRSILSKFPNCPSSFKELCIQTCDADRGNRPDAVDVLEWIESILEEEGKSPREAMEKVEKGSRKKKKKKAKSATETPYSENPNGILEAMMKNPKKFGVGTSSKVLKVESIACLSTDEEAEVESEDEVELGYETDDSFQPPATVERSMDEVEDKQEKRASRLMDFISSSNDDQETETEPDKRGSRLLQFLKTSEETGKGETFETIGKDILPPPLPPRKSTAPESSTKISDFGDIPEAPPEETLPENEDNSRGRTRGRSSKLNAMLGTEVPAPRRRRSLDRGYLYARSKLAAGDDDRKSVAGSANVSRFRQVWHGKQIRLNAVKIPPAEEIGRMLEAQELIPTDLALGIVKKATAVLKKEPNLLQLKAPVNVVGDIHGQFFDLRNLFQIGGDVGKKRGKTSYLFLGDYVDRGEFSCEVLLYLFTLKVKHKDALWLIRGNHESRSVASYFGFKEECEMKYGTQVFNACVEAFQAMPIAAVVETAAGRFLCLHGGISPNVTSLDQFIEFDRFAEPGMNGFLCDLLWSDPVKDDHEDGQDQSLGEFLSIDYLPNPARGCSYRYGFRALVTFLATNRLVALIRAHEVQEEGYRYHFQDLSGAKGAETAQVTPPVITVFSAPNYCGRYGNKAAFIRIHDKAPGKVRAKLIGGGGIRPMQLLEPVQFIAVPHPRAIKFENATAQEVVRIETACPYMPSTFFSFIKRAVDLLEEDTERMTRAREKLKEKAKPPPPSPTAEAPDVPKKATEKAPKKNKNWKAAALLGLGEGVPDSSQVRSPKAVKSKKHQLYEDAAAADGINEMNPALIAEKMEKAKQKVSKAGGIKLPGFTSALKVASRTSKRLSMNRKSASQAPRVAGVTDGVDLSALKEAEPDSPPSDSAEVASAAFFTSKELIALQTLFLMIDHKEDGHIDAEDLVAWSEEDGTAVPRDEALLCIEAVDADGDSMIGIEDYLTFAARCKERWLLNEYNNVVNDIRLLKHTADEGGRPSPALEDIDSLL